MEQHIILAPHADDEIIGCFSVLHKATHILFGSIDAEREGQGVIRMIGAESGVFPDLASVCPTPNIHQTIYAPDPNYELHPLHRSIGAVAESYARLGHKVIYYSTNMNTPYIREVSTFKHKQNILNKMYRKKSKLWEYDWKYFLFEGYTTHLLNLVK